MIVNCSIVVIKLYQTQIQKFKTNFPVACLETWSLPSVILSESIAVVTLIKRARKGVWHNISMGIALVGSFNN